MRESLPFHRVCNRVPPSGLFECSVMLADLRSVTPAPLKRIPLYPNESCHPRKNPTISKRAQYQTEKKPPCPKRKEILPCPNETKLPREPRREKKSCHTVRGQPGTQAIRGWPDIPGWPGYGRPTVDPWMAWVCSGPTGDPGHPRMARAIQG